MDNIVRVHTLQMCVEGGEGGKERHGGREWRGKRGVEKRTREREKEVQMYTYTHVHSDFLFSDLLHLLRTPAALALVLWSMAWPPATLSLQSTENSLVTPLTSRCSMGQNGSVLYTHMYQQNTPSHSRKTQ